MYKLLYVDFFVSFMAEKVSLSQTVANISTHFNDVFDTYFNFTITVLRQCLNTLGLNTQCRCNVDILFHVAS